MLLVSPIRRIILQNRVAELIHSVVLYEGVDVKHGAYVRNSGRRSLDGAAAVSLEGSKPVNMKNRAFW
jgi:hypothetical protein